MEFRRRMKSFVIAVIMVGLCSAVLFSQQSTGKMQSIKIGLRSDISTIYPWKMTDVETYYILQNVYETLIRLKKDADEIEPGLALKWTPSKDYKTWTFSLRQNVKFHDGSIFNSDSVIATFSLVPSFPGKVEKIDDYTVRFNLDKPNAAFVLSLTVANYGIVGEATIKCFNNKKCGKIIAVGTGPFRLESWQPRKQVVLKKNQNYWGDKAYLDEAIFIELKTVLH
jgi:peptide/nickel transport system substrate-binding protein